MASLYIIGGPTAGTRIDLGKEHTVIGRTPECDIVVPITAISRRHARVTRRNGRLVLEDLQSRGCTYLNMRQIRGLASLSRMKVCTVGDAARQGVGSPFRGTANRLRREEKAGLLPA